MWVADCKYPLTPLLGPKDHCRHAHNRPESCPSQGLSTPRDLWFAEVALALTAEHEKALLGRAREMRERIPRGSMTEIKAAVWYKTVPSCVPYSMANLQMIAGKCIDPFLDL